MVSQDFLRSVRGGSTAPVGISDDKAPRRKHKKVDQEQQLLILNSQLLMQRELHEYVLVNAVWQELQSKWFSGFIVENVLELYLELTATQPLYKQED